MRKLLLIAAGLAIGAAVAVVLSAREQLDSPSTPASDAHQRWPEVPAPPLSETPASG
ncbi:MAG: hypothetical protein K1X87_09830 [Dehalococcoidia bacterium]|nr:hypothetical protein [Dehalococcoidia bacterium]HRC62791.1 hypothetical protein [Dehalococcoidia bacterium]